jgi:hypothetical protein
MTGTSYDDEEDGFETILDGTSLHGWKMCGPGIFVPWQSMIISNGGMGDIMVFKEKVRGLYSESKLENQRMGRQFRRLCSHCRPG